MTAGQNAGQLRRANRSGMLVVAAVAAGAVAIGILATLAVARPAAVAPAAAPVPVPSYEFRLDEKGINRVAVPWSVPVPSYRVPPPGTRHQRSRHRSVVGPGPIDRRPPRRARPDDPGRRSPLHPRTADAGHHRSGQPGSLGPGAAHRRRGRRRIGHQVAGSPGAGADGRRRGRSDLDSPHPRSAGHPGQALQQLLPALGHERPVTSRRP